MRVASILARTGCGFNRATNIGRLFDADPNPDHYEPSDSIRDKNARTRI